MANHFFQQTGKNKKNFLKNFNKKIVKKGLKMAIFANTRWGCGKNFWKTKKNVKKL